MDVARRSGVHASTVSRTLSRPDLVAPETRLRVEAAVAELGFAPNRQARSLIDGRTGAIGLLVPDIANPYFAEIIQAAQAEAALNDLVLLVADTEHTAKGETMAFQALAPHVDGIVVCTPVLDDRPAGALPVVYVNRQAAGVASVTVDQGEIVRLAADHLSRLGHENVAWLNGPSTYWSARQRRDAIAALSSNAQHQLIDDTEPTFDGGWKATIEALETNATAVVAFNDVMAFGVLAAAANHGVAVPSGLSVVANDDTRQAVMSWPPLTSVASPTTLIGHSAVQALLRVRSGEPAQSTVLSPTLSVRGSTDVVPALKTRGQPRRRPPQPLHRSTP